MAASPLPRFPLTVGKKSSLKEKASLPFLVQIGGKDLERGSATLIALFIVASLALGVSFLNKRLLYWHEEIKQRENTYLCLKTTFDEFASLSQTIRRTNMMILAITAGSVITLQPGILKSIKVIKLFQQGAALKAFYHLMRSPFCHGLQKLALFKVFPLKRKAHLLKRDPLGRALFKTKSLPLRLPSRGSFPFLFLVTGRVKANPFELSHSRELPIGRLFKFGLPLKELAL